MTRLIALNDLRRLFATPSTWLILGGLQFILAWSFLTRLDSFLQLQSQLTLIANAPGATQLVVAPLFGVIALLLMILTPVFTMRLLAEERRNQTLALLLSSPVSATQIVLGKFLGLLLFLWLIVICCAAMTLVLVLGTPLDFGLLLANTIGLMLLVASYAALGLYVSALSSQPVVAAIGALAALFGMWLADIGAGDKYRIWHALTPTGHFQNFNGGLLDSTGVAYYLLFCIVFLMLTVLRMHNSRFYR
jgi:gliding motility-associated transport system permease protein